MEPELTKQNKTNEKKKKKRKSLSKYLEIYFFKKQNFWKDVIFQLCI